MKESAKYIHLRAVKSIANWQDVTFLDHDVDVVVQGPANRVPVRYAAGDTYALNVWFNGAETVLPAHTVELLDRHEGWVRAQFVRVNVDITAPGIWFETAIKLTPDMLRRRADPSETWKPAGVGWKLLREDDGSTIWFRARTWEVYR